MEDLKNQVLASGLGKNGDLKLSFRLPNNESLTGHFSKAGSSKVTVYVFSTYSNCCIILC